MSSENNKNNIIRESIYDLVKKFIVGKIPFMLYVFCDKRMEDKLPIEIYNKYSKIGVIPLLFNDGTLEYATYKNDDLFCGTIFENEVCEFWISKYSICGIVDIKGVPLFFKNFYDDGDLQKDHSYQKKQVKSIIDLGFNNIKPYNYSIKNTDQDALKHSQSKLKLNKGK